MTPWNLRLFGLLAAGCVAVDQPSPDDTDSDSPSDTDADTDTDTAPVNPACNQPLPEAWDAPPRMATSDDPNVVALAAAVDDLAVKLLPRLEPSTGTVAFSMLSVHAMFATLLPAADGPGYNTLADVLGITASQPDHHAALAALLDDLDDDDRGWGFGWAAGFWHRPSLVPAADWVDDVGTLYGVVPEALDFQADGEAARDLLNGWVNDHTRCLIPEFYPEGYDFSSKLHVSIHAMALEARWERPFDAAFTRDREFRLAGGGTVRVPTMESESFAGAAHHEHSDTVVRLPYQGSDLAMYLLVPDEPTDPNTLIGSVEAGALDALVARVPREGELAIRLPKWTSVSTHDLIDPLEAIGYEPLTGQPLPGLCEGCLYPQIVRQVVVVQVDEEGTRAAAATSGESDESDPAWLDIDRPFVWFLRDDVSGVVLWIGWVANPA